MSGFELWLLLVALPELDDATELLAFLSGIGSIFAGFAAVFTHSAMADDTPDWALKWSRRACWILPSVFVSCILLASILPDEKQMYMLIGGHYATNIEGIDRLPPALVRAVEVWLEQVASAAEGASE